MLSNAKHLLAGYTLSTRVVAGRLYVILSETKDLLAGYTLSTVIPREHSDRGNLSQCVILSETKDLKACTTDHRHGDLEILHSVQNDRV